MAGHAEGGVLLYDPPVDEYAIVTHPVLVGGGTPFFTALDDQVKLSLVETRR